MVGSPDDHRPISDRGGLSGAGDDNDIGVTKATGLGLAGDHDGRWTGNGGRIPEVQDVRLMTTTDLDPADMLLANSAEVPAGTPYGSLASQGVERPPRAPWGNDTGCPTPSSAFSGRRTSAPSPPRVGA